jgi:hypothetical protein
VGGTGAPDDYSWLEVIVDTRPLSPLFLLHSSGIHLLICWPEELAW